MNNTYTTHMQLRRHVVTLHLHVFVNQLTSDVDGLFHALQVRIEGLAGREYLDNLAEKRRCAESAPALRFSGEVDRIYLDVPGPLRVRPCCHRTPIFRNPWKSICWESAPACWHLIASGQGGALRSTRDSVFS